MLVTIDIRAPGGGDPRPEDIDRSIRVLEGVLAGDNPRGSTRPVVIQDTISILYEIKRKMPST